MASAFKYFQLNDKVYLKYTLLFFLFWLICTGPLRNLGSTDSQVLNILLGVAPNFFAGITLVFWMTYAISAGPLKAFITAFLVLAFGEFIQLFMERQTADVLDLIASALGGVLGVWLVKIIERKQLLSDHKVKP